MRFNDLTGKLFGMLKVISRDSTTNEKNIRWNCKCKCGTIKSISGVHLLSGGTKSCGCKQGIIKPIAAGKKFGRLTVIDLAHTTKEGAYWNCICTCGKKRVVRGRALRAGRPRSCGCLREETLKKWTQNFLRNGRIGVSMVETAFLDWAETLVGRKIDRQYQINNRFYDGRLGNILIESDCSYWHTQAKDAIKDELAKQAGFTLYRFELRSLREFEKQKPLLRERLLQICPP